VKTLAATLMVLLLSAGAAFAQVDPLVVQPDGSVNVNGPLVLQGTLVVAVPIGSIIAWHKNFGSGAPALPEGWIECDGASHSVPGSPFANGQGMVTPPNLNGEGRFLRGASSSGASQPDALKSHTHSLSVSSGSNNGTTAPAGRSTSTGTSTTAIAAQGDTETRPINMSVVWIIRVK
jgi:hypothetical protein